MTKPGPITPERTLERYALFEEIASGGMAAVHYGRLLGPVGFSRMVAIKRLHAHLARNPDFVQMLTDEARLAARVRHPNVVSMLDVVTSAGEVFLVMDFVLGESLSRLLQLAEKKGEHPPVPIATGIAVGMLHGLHAAHETKGERGELLGIVHRDVSPQNVLVGVDGVARVLDFGIAKADALREQQTKDGVLKGKIGYLAPEQVRGEATDRRTDVYAASVVLWEALAGGRLFKTSSPESAFHQIINSVPQPPSRFNEQVPRALDAIVLRGLSREPARRFATAREMALELESALAPATASRVGIWVEAVGGEVLAPRADRLAEIESIDLRTPDPTLDEPIPLVRSRPSLPRPPPSSRAFGEAYTVPELRRPPPAPPGNLPDAGVPLAPLAEMAPPRAWGPLAAGVAFVVVLGAGMAVIVAVQQQGSSPVVARATASNGAPRAVAAADAEPNAIPSDSPCTSSVELRDALDVSTGPSAHFTCALRRDRTVWCWGDNQQGQLGVGSTRPSGYAAQVRRLRDVTQLAAGTTHACAVQQNGTVWCWGRGLVDRATQVLGLADIVDVAVGGTHACAFDRAGALFCWGENERGQLGSTSLTATLAVRVEGLGKVTNAAAGSRHSCAIVADEVRCWGDNAFGQLGTGRTDRDVHPWSARVLGVTGAKQLALGDKTSFARTADGRVVGWGFNVKKPIEVLASGARHVAAGGRQNCAAKVDGTVVCWGFNDFGQLGTPANDDSAAPLVVNGLASTARLAVGDVHACALDADGAVRCWGGNDAGQLGRGPGDQGRHPDPRPVRRFDCAVQ